jgi:acyl-CoA synthetase (AMP-forming)/AMP-acid ligase II
MSVMTAQPTSATREAIINVADHLATMARQQPETRALVWSTGGHRYAHWTFAELNEKTERVAAGLIRLGVGRGMRTIVMVRPTREFFAITFALLKIGAVPVLVDPGMGMRRMVECLASVNAEAFIGIPLAHVLRKLNPPSFKSVKILVTVGTRLAWGGSTFSELLASPTGDGGAFSANADDPAAIIFTTGSTGPPKGVLYRHGNFAAQVSILRQQFNIQPGEIDLPTFPLFALFDPALGMTAVLPEMDPTRPADVDPAKIIRAICDQQVTHMFGSPALLDRVGRYGEANGIKIPSVRRVISAGAPVRPEIIERFSSMLNGDAEIHTPYGATEALPVATIGSREILGKTRDQTERGAGTCVGRPVSAATVRTIRISDDPIERWSDDLVLPIGQIGEIAVKGPMATREYCTSESANRLAKIRDGGDVWHRMGDVGYLDEQGRLWFCGRKAHRVVTASETLFTDPCEAIFNNHAAVFRSALVGVGDAAAQTPVMCIELEKSHPHIASAALVQDLLSVARRHAHTRTINEFMIHPSFPVDIRHNAKIFREKLAVWAAEQLR